MVVIVELGVGVSICIDGKPAPEYDDPNPVVSEEGDYVVCSRYVESTDDAEYTIIYECQPQQRWLNDNPENRLTFILFIDGKERCAHSLTQKLVLNGGKFTIEGAETYRGYGKPIGLSRFRFRSITSVEDADHQVVERDRERVETLGLIRVEVWRSIRRGENTTDPDEADEDDCKTSDMTIAQKALQGKALSHGTSFSPAVDKEVQYLFDLGDVDDYPLAVFSMKYRSKEALRQELVIPCSPHPKDYPSSPADLRSRSPMPDNYPRFDNLSHDELVRLAKERLIEIKKENEVQWEIDDGVDLGINEHARKGSLKILRDTNGQEMIDLTND